MNYSSGSVSTMLERLSDGDMSVVEPLWRRYWKRLRTNAKDFVGKMQSMDEDDLAQVVFMDVIQRIADQRISNVENRRRLWRLMEVSTYHIAINMHRLDRAGRRAETRYRMPSDNIDSQLPEFFVSLEDDLTKLSKIIDNRSKTIVQMVLHGYGSAEIAQRLQTSQRTIQRKLITIRDAWSDLQKTQID